MSRRTAAVAAVPRVRGRRRAARGRGSPAAASRRGPPGTALRPLSARGEAAGARLPPASWRTSTGSARCSTSAASGWRLRDTCGPTRCCTRCSISRRRSIRISALPTGSARSILGEPYPGGPGRPDLAITLLQKGLAFQPRKWQYMEDLGFVYYWHLRDYRTAAEWFERARERARGSRVAAAARGGHARRRRTHRGVPRHLAAAREVRRALAPRCGDAPPDPARRRSTKSSALSPASGVSGTPSGRAGHLARARRRGADSGVPLDAAGSALHHRSASGRIAVARDSPLWPMPGQTARARSDAGHAVAAIAARGGGPLDRQLPERLHLPHSPRPSVVWPGRAVRAATGRSPGTRTCPW